MSNPSTSNNDAEPNDVSRQSVPGTGGPTEFDVLVVGGGIHGVGVAQAAAAAGYSTLLIEQTRLAAGTSSRSSKLIHGGLRYLEQHQWGLVRESLRERELLLRLAPSLVHRHAFHIPVYPQTTRRPWLLRTGLSLYALLAGLRQGTRFTSLPRSQWDQLDGLNLDQLQAVYRYYDAQTDDQKLTAAVMYSATQLGARWWCPARLVRATIHHDHCEVVIDHQDTLTSCRALTLVNAAGPWAQHVLQHIEPTPPAVAVDLVQGTHMELQGALHQGSYYLEAPQDRRAVFVMPWYERTLVGTTETLYHGPPSDVRPFEQEIEYLHAVFAHYFPGRSRNQLNAWAGLRVLPKSTEHAFHRSRETQLPAVPPERPRLVSIFGGKLTGYRLTAQKVLDCLAATLPQRPRLATTDRLTLVEPPAGWTAARAPRVPAEGPSPVREPET